jgi:MIP family channel proteins
MVTGARLLSSPPQAAPAVQETRRRQAQRARTPTPYAAAVVTRLPPANSIREVPQVQDRGPAAYVAEFIGTFALVFFVTAAVSIYVTPPSPQTPGLQPFIDFSVIGLVHVFVLFMLIQTLALVSGAHFNPAVTVAMTALRQIKPPDAFIYIVVQLAGAVAGALVTKALLVEFDNADAVNFGATAVGDRLNGEALLGGIAEGIGTFFLVWAIVGVAVNPRGSREWAGLAIGTTLGLGVLVLGPLTGAGLNPARWFGPALVSGEFGDFNDWLFAYVLAPVLGGLLAAMVYFNLFMTPGKKGDEGMEPVG